MSELLRAEHLVKEFPVRGGAVHAVSDVSFSIEKGETLGLVGESGCGKSTLGKLLLDLLPLTSGKVYFKEQDLSQIHGEEKRVMRRGMQMIFQDPYASLDPRMSVGQIIMEPLNAHRIGKNRRERADMARELISRVGLRPEFFIRYPHQFSGGQRQRIGIARALALNPELIICDEPVSALDVSIQAQILNLLGDLQKQLGLTYLFISHDLNVVRYLSDRVIVMFLGQICEMAGTEELYAHPRHPYTRFLLSSVPQPDPTLRNRERALLAGEASSPVDPPSGCRFHPRCPYADTVCRSEKPALRGTGDGHMCACHHPLEG
ncbi:MAG: ATP-binding cassette domain-containing protein [Clostridia bacterium]|nr:ATP-binding cassette domain-containing protein [Clostridia bacterium]